MTLTGIAVIALRTMSVLLGSAAFALLLSNERLLQAGAFLSYMTLFAIGVNWRLIHAVAIRRLELRTDVTWSGGGGATCIGVVITAMLCAALGLKTMSLALLGAHGVAINITYIGAKTSCLVAGCCRRPDSKTGDADLRIREMAISAGLAAASFAAMIYGVAWLAAAIGNGGHLALRLYSYAARKELTDRPVRFLARKPDLVPLVIAALVAPALA